MKRTTGEREKVEIGRGESGEKRRQEGEQEERSRVRKKREKTSLIIFYNNGKPRRLSQLFSYNLPPNK